MGYCGVIYLLEHCCDDFETCDADLVNCKGSTKECFSDPIIIKGCKKSCQKCPRKFLNSEISCYTYKRLLILVLPSFDLKIFILLKENCVWTEWRESGCSIKCGEGTMNRTRSKTIEEKNGGICSGSPIEITRCNGTCDGIQNFLTDFRWLV